MIFAFIIHPIPNYLHLKLNSSVMYKHLSSIFKQMTHPYYVQIVDKNASKILHQQRIQLFVDRRLLPILSQKKWEKNEFTEPNRLRELSFDHDRRLSGIPSMIFWIRPCTTRDYLMKGNSISHLIVRLKYQTRWASEKRVIDILNLFLWLSTVSLL
jgi:hypothetical protein